MKQARSRILDPAGHLLVASTVVAMAANAIMLPAVVSSTDGQVETVVGLRFVKPLRDTRFGGIEIDYTLGGQKYKTIYPVAVHLCLTPTVTCQRPPISKAIANP